MERLWCVKCQHGVAGLKDQLCPDCVSKGKGRNENKFGDAGILMTPKEAEQQHRKHADAIKLMREKGTVKPYKGMDEVEAELRAKLTKEITEQVTKQVKDAFKGSETPLKTPSKSGASKPLKGDK